MRRRPTIMAVRLPSGTERRFVASSPEASLLDRPSFIVTLGALFIGTLFGSLVVSVLLYEPPSKSAVPSGRDAGLAEVQP